MAISKDSKKNPILLNNVKYVSGLYFNLLSLSKAMKVFELKGTEDQHNLRYNNLRYQFDHKIKSGSGILYGLCIITSTSNKRIPYNKAHKFLVQTHSTVTKETMKKLGYLFSKEPDLCKHCAVLKSKQKMCLK